MRAPLCIRSVTGRHSWAYPRRGFAHGWTCEHCGCQRSVERSKRGRYRTVYVECPTVSTTTTRS